ncbi:hypothetical protein [Paenirhodobacter sp.]|uniref:hypothetical protein n=1 Tax=Paenirhodobacter sp. TaxID=1965326 RepID=UPI003B3E4686
MCSLCGILGCDDHWSNPVARPGVFSRNTDGPSRRAEAARRLAAANRVLSFRRLKLSDWQGRSYVLAGPTGASTVFDALSHLWPEAEALAPRGFDPLDPDLIAWMERP